MENASKALLMVGSVLIGIILLSLAVYIYGIMRDAKSMESSIITEEQLVKYNQEFLSYDKKLMYGTDVISVLNKAIDNNKRYADTDESNAINIAFKLKDDISAVTTTYTWKNKQYVSKTTKVKSTGNSKYSYNFATNKLYSIKNDLNMINKFLKTSSDPTAVKNPKEPKPQETYTITYTGFSDFKRMIFKCTKVEYNAIGKVCYMEFEQIQSSTYNTNE